MGDLTEEGAAKLCRLLKDFRRSIGEVIYQKHTQDSFTSQLNAIESMILTTFIVNDDERMSPTLKIVSSS